jgi:hypothetical protein
MQFILALVLIRSYLLATCMSYLYLHSKYEENMLDPSDATEYTERLSKIFYISSTWNKILDQIWR